MTSKFSSATHESRRQAALKFSQTWQGRGYEKGETAQFWTDLLRDVVGMEDLTTNVFFEKRTASGGFIDVSIPDAKTFIEQKSLGISLDKTGSRQAQEVTPFQQAFNYANAMPNSKRPSFIIVCNFDEFRIHDLNAFEPAKNYLSFTLDELPEQFHLLDFLIDPQRARQKREEKASMDAGSLIGKLYSALRDQYQNPDAPENQHALNVLCVRLVFCLFAEDAGLFPKDAFFTYLNDVSPTKARSALKELFEVLNTPVDQRDPYLEAALKVFPYVNGGLFAKAEEIPPFTDEILSLLVNEVSKNTNWAEISPTIFGGVFESTLNPETRRAGGMHYTSPENIHKVIDPLFADALTQELTDILETPGQTPLKRGNALKRFHTKIAGLTFFDPACGSGNFLTETYITLRRLENKVLSELSSQNVLAFEDVGASPLKVSLDQFYGLEINDFAVSVASTALWIAKLQANVEARSIITSNFEDLPLTDAAQIRHGNALRVDWREVIDPSECDYIIGNPPFLGYSRLNDKQKADRAAIFGKAGGLLDYVACWHKKSADYMRGTAIEAALVSTNSICQGQQVSPLWEPLFNDGLHINFAHRTFTWSNESTDQAHVFCIIVGFSYVEREHKITWDYHRVTKDERARGSAREIGTARIASNINGYLADAPDVFLKRRSKPISSIPEMAKGFQSTDNGNLLLTSVEREELLLREPAAEPWIRKFSMGAEFIHGVDRYCLWLPGITGAELKNLPIVRARIEANRRWRSVQTPTGDAYKLRDRPHLLRPTSKFNDGSYIGIPKVSSERRRFIPMAFVEDRMIPGDKLYFIPTDSLFVFGVLISTFHNAWMRSVAGRLKSDYSYGNTTVYNNLVFPIADEALHQSVEACAQAVLDARASYEGATLADLYDPNNDFLYPTLVSAHHHLDVAVERAYGVDFSHLGEVAREQAIVAHLFELYAHATSA